MLLQQILENTEADIFADAPALIDAISAKLGELTLKSKSVESGKIMIDVKNKDGIKLTLKIENQTFSQVFVKAIARGVYIMGDQKNPSKNMKDVVDAAVSVVTATMNEKVRLVNSGVIKN